MMHDDQKMGLAGRLAALFIHSKLTPIAVVASILLGVFAVWQLPREEEPQIKVPMIDVMVALEGASPAEVENRVTLPMEKLLWEIPDLEYLYSTSSEGHSLVTLRYKVGTDMEAALVRLNQKFQANYDRMPKGASMPLIKPRGIDDVPILTLTFHSATIETNALRRLAKEVENSVKSVPMVAETFVAGGNPQALRVEFSPEALVARDLDAMELAQRLRAENSAQRLKPRAFANAETLLETGKPFATPADLSGWVVGVDNGKPVYLRDIATVSMTACEPDNYVMHIDAAKGTLENAVTVSVAKRPNANAIDVVNAVLRKVDSLKGTLIPADVGVTVTRDYGHTAAEKSNELLLHMGIAVFGVALLVLVFLGWRESLVVLLAIPSTLALTLFVFYLYGYTLNRITLFALIFSIGILVDDAIVVVENIARHLRLPNAGKLPLTQVALRAVDEVGNSTILATWAVIAAILPMAFVGGLMGPYMRPIPIGSSAAMLFSLFIAFTVTPWAFVRILKRHAERAAEKAAQKEADAHDEDAVPSDWFTRLYMHIMRPLLEHARWRWAFLGIIVALLLGALSLVPLGVVQVKMLPFDNKSEFQIVIDAPEGTPLEATARIAKEMAEAVAKDAAVRDVQIYAGVAAPFNFSGMVRHYFLRKGSNVADVQVNLVGKGERAEQSHAIAKRARERVTPIAQANGVVVTVAEVPPGPPVLQSIVAEIYGGDEAQRRALAGKVKAILSGIESVVDVNDFMEAPQEKLRFVVDREKAAQNGVSQAAITRALALATGGVSVDLWHDTHEREDIDVFFRLPESQKASVAKLLEYRVRPDVRPGAPLVPLSELVKAVPEQLQGSLYRKNLKSVVYVTADVAGTIESPAYALFKANQELAQLDLAPFGESKVGLDVYNLSAPFDDAPLGLKWDGEWHITLEVFRDLGLAFAAVLVLIAMLMVGWFRSYTVPLVVMTAIPFSLIGILPAHALLGAFFTATSMIGFMAGAGIVVRNSIILVDFIELRLSHGHSLEDSVVEAGAVRFRPMLLTALAVVVGASVILADPIFQGLAISLMFGEIASLLISRMAVPVLYFMLKHRGHKAKGA